MVTEAEARRLAEAQLVAMGPDAYVITHVRETEVGWVFFYDSKRHQETGDLRDALGGNAPILVHRSDGSVHHTGTAQPVEEYLERYMHRDPADERSWHP